MIKGCSYLKNPRHFGVRKGFIFPKENYRERIVNLLKVIVSKKNFGFIYVARRDIFLHNKLMNQRFNSINYASRCLISFKVAIL